MKCGPSIRTEVPVRSLVSRLVNNNNENPQSV